MRLVLWTAFFVVCNIVGVETFKAAVTLPFDEAILPGVLSVPLIGLAALGAIRVMDAWQERER
jgi:hydrogenase/urease accessory protein HupE